jgi:hypothetical protein
VEGKEYIQTKAQCDDCGKERPLNVERRCDRCEVARRNAAQHVERLAPTETKEK